MTDKESFKNVCGVYKITNSAGQVYIGASGNIIQRYWKYRTLNFTHPPLLYDSIEKQGWDTHLMEVVEICTKADLQCVERYWQQHYDVISDKGLNAKIEPCGDEKGIYRESTLKKLSDNKKGEKHHYWGKKGENNPFYGKRHTEESKQKMRESTIGQVISEETRRKISESNRGERHYLYGKNHTEEARLKMSQNHADFRGGKSARAKLVLCTLTGVYYDCVGDAAEAIGIPRARLTSWLNGRRPNKSSMIYC